MKIIILAGGTGSRLWPASKKNNPKQLKPLLGKETLLKSAVKRVKVGFKSSDIFLSINRHQLSAVKRDLKSLVPLKNYITEPVKKDTAAAIGLACLRVIKEDPEAVIATVNSDHHIKNNKEFVRVLKSAEKAVNKYPDHLVLIGLNPSYPETGYGYIKIKKEVDQVGKDKIYSVDSFKEKPDLKTSQKYLKSWQYLWNPAYFVFKAQTMLDLFAKHLPDQHKILMKIKNNPKSLNSEFSKIEPISIDYGIMEKAGKMLCLPANFDWVDVGHWRTLQEVLAKTRDNNVVKGRHVGLNSSGNLIYSYTGKLIATIGLKDLIVVETEEAILVCPKDRAQEVKQLVDKLKEEKLDKYL